MAHVTYVDAFRPSERIDGRLFDLLVVLGASLFVALTAQVTIPLPFSPVPITGQTFGVVLVGAALGSRRGALAILAYLLEGVMGLPVFAGLRAGAGVLAGPTGGYLLGFVAAAYATGWLAERGWDRRVPTAVAAMTVGTLIIFAFGLPWLSTFVGAGRVLELGFIPFVPGAIIKLAAAGLVLPAAWRITGRPGASR